MPPPLHSDFSRGTTRIEKNHCIFAQIINLNYIRFTMTYECQSTNLCQKTGKTIRWPAIRGDLSNAAAEFAREFDKFNLYIYFVIKSI